MLKSTAAQNAHGQQHSSAVLWNFRPIPKIFSGSYSHRQTSANLSSFHTLWPQKSGWRIVVLWWKILME